MTKLIEKKVIFNNLTHQSFEVKSNKFSDESPTHYLISFTSRFDSKTDAEFFIDELLNNITTKGVESS